MIKLEHIDLQSHCLDSVVVPACSNKEIHHNKIINRLINLAKISTGFKGGKKEIITLTHPLNLKIGKIILLGLGISDEVDEYSLRCFGGKASKITIDYGLNEFSCFLPDLENSFNIKSKGIFSSILEGILLSDNKFELQSLKESKHLESITLFSDKKKFLKHSKLIYKIEAKCKGAIIARNLTNMPPNYKDPKKLADLIKRRICHSDLNIIVFDESWLLKNGFNAMLVVNKGSKEKACLVIMDYKPTTYNKTVLLIGKGVVFDSGGINLKPGTGLEEMKTDMAGAASVAGVAFALNKLNLNIRVIGLLPLVKNMPSGESMCPGDVIESLSGKTIEIKNTDAEGRLTLVDPITWGINEYNPDFIVDIATLTGACVIALGDNVAGFFSNNEYLSKIINKSGRETSEFCWRLPLPKMYRKLLKSDIADISNISESRNGGAITAAIFLSEFINEVPWAHIDIAGTARLKNKNDYCEAGASGFGVRLICNMLESL